MSRREENVRLVQEAMDAYDRGDLEGALEFMDEGIEVYTPPDLGNPGTYHGREGFLAWAAEWLGAFEDWSQEVRGMDAVGERHVVVDIHQSGKGAGSGVPVEMDVAYMYEVRNGKGVRFHLYSSHEEAVEAARRGEGELDE
jgi:ketosteroid isomerase-like protein